MNHWDDWHQMKDPSAKPAAKGRPTGNTAILQERIDDSNIMHTKKRLRD